MNKILKSKQGKIRSLKFSGYLEAVKMNTPFIFPSDRVFYDIQGNVLTGEISANFEDGLKGGVIVFSTDVDADRLTNRGKIGNVLEKFTDAGGYSAGHFFRGRHSDSRSGRNYSEKSLSIEIIGVSPDILIDIAEQMTLEFDQKGVLVKDHNNGKIFLIDGGVK